MTETSQHPKLESETRHNRQVFREIVLPIGLGFVVMVAIMAAVLIPPLLPTPVHVATLSSILMTLCLLLPSFLCLMGFYLLLVYMIFGMNTFNRASARQMRRLNRLSQTITDGTVKATDTVNRRTADARVKIAGIEAAMDGALRPRPDGSDQDEENENGDSQ